MYFSIILTTQLPSQFAEKLFLGWFRIRGLFYEIFLNTKEMKPLEKSITLAISLKVAIGKVKYIFKIDILVNQQQNNISVVGEMAFLISGKGVHLLKLPAISLQACNFTKNEHLHIYFSRILARFKLLFIVFQNSKNTYFSKHFSMTVSASTENNSHTYIFNLL